MRRRHGDIVEDRRRRRPQDPAIDAPLLDDIECGRIAERERAREIQARLARPRPVGDHHLDAIARRDDEVERVVAVSRSSAIRTVPRVNFAAGANGSKLTEPEPPASSFSVLVWIDAAVDFQREIDGRRRQGLD